MKISGSLSQFSLVRWVEEGEGILVLFGGMHSSVEAEQRLEEGWVQVVAVTGMCGLRGEAPPEEATRGSP